MASSANERQALEKHVRDRLVGYFGAESFEVWRAKEGLHKHATDEVAAVVIAELASLLDRIDEGVVDELVTQGELASPIVFPWENRY